MCSFWSFGGKYLNYNNSTTLQSQKAVTAYLTSKQLMPFCFARQSLYVCVWIPTEEQSAARSTDRQQDAEVRVHREQPVTTRRVRQGSHGLTGRYSVTCSVFEKQPSSGSACLAVGPLVLRIFCGDDVNLDVNITISDKRRRLFFGQRQTAVTAYFSSMLELRNGTVTDDEWT